jgi:hypothetical protein
MCSQRQRVSRGADRFCRRGSHLADPSLVPKRFRAPSRRNKTAYERQHVVIHQPIEASERAAFRARGTLATPGRRARLGHRPVHLPVSGNSDGASSCWIPERWRSAPVRDARLSGMNCGTSAGWRAAHCFDSRVRRVEHDNCAGCALLHRGCSGVGRGSWPRAETRSPTLAHSPSAFTKLARRGVADRWQESRN